MTCLDPESERIMLEETEKAFQQYAVRRKSLASETNLSSSKSLIFELQK